MIRIALQVAAALLGLYAAFLLAVVAGALLRAIAWRRRRAAAAAVEPAICEAVVEFLAGGGGSTALRGFATRHRRELESGLLAFRDTVSGSARDRLCALTMELALAHDWCDQTRSKDRFLRREAFSRLAFVCSYEPCRRMAGDILARGLDDSDPQARLAAARALIQGGEMAGIERVFEMALSRDGIVRIVLSEELRKHAAALCDSAVPEALRSTDWRRALAALEMLAAWERAMPLPDIEELILHREREVRLRALRVAALSPADTGSRSAILRALADEDPGISAEAALTAGRMKLAEALPLLARAVRRGPATAARTAAEALAGMGQAGIPVLEELSGAADRAAAAIASEALARGPAGRRL